MENTETHRELRLVDASKGKRLANYLIDIVCFYILFSIILVAYLAMDPYGNLIIHEDWLEYVIVYLGQILYYTGFEASLGKTPGKFVTRTKVVSEFGEQPELSKLIGRSFARLIPFEAFSFLGDGLRGWHDTLSKTRVVDLRASILPEEDHWEEDIIDANL